MVFWTCGILDWKHIHVPELFKQCVRGGRKAVNTNIVMLVGERLECVVYKLGELIRLIEPDLELELALCVWARVELLDNV